jgi:hypothetical protein
MPSDSPERSHLMSSVAAEHLRETANSRIGIEHDVGRALPEEGKAVESRCGFGPFVYRGGIFGTRVLSDRQFRGPTSVTSCGTLAAAQTLPFVMHGHACLT